MADRRTPQARAAVPPAARGSAPPVADPAGVPPPNLGTPAQTSPQASPSQAPAPEVTRAPSGAARRGQAPRRGTLEEGAAQTPAGVLTPRAGGTPAGSRTWTLELPAGMPLLSLNGRHHWALRNRRSQEIKKAAWALAKQARIPPLERVSVAAEYQPPDRRRRDADNPVLSVKAALDGIVAAGCLPSDDSRHVAEVSCRIGPVYQKGRLVLHITEVTS